jgi:hypothetical protein
VKINASRGNFNYNETEEAFELYQRGFWVETKPVLVTDFDFNTYSRATDQPGDGGWGERWEFTVNVTDEDDDTVAVKLWVSSDIYTGDSWGQPNISAMSNNSVQGQNVSIKYVLDGWRSGGNPGLGDHWFKFNVSETSVDFPQNTYETTNGSFTIDKDDLNLIHVTGDNTTVNRTSGSQVLTLHVHDTDSDTYPTSGITGLIWVTNDTQNNYVSIASQASGGYINTSVGQFNPTCNFAVGPQKWKGGVIDADYYKIMNSSEYRINITTIELQIHYFEPVDGLMALKGLENVTIRLNVSDDCGAVPGADVTITSQQLTTSPQEKDCVNDQNPPGVINYEGSGNYSCIFRDDTHQEPYPIWAYGYVNVSAKAEKQYYNDSVTNLDIGSYYLTSEPSISLGNPLGASATTAWGDIWTFPVTITDPDMDGEQGSEINVSFWLNLTGEWEFQESKTCTPSLGSCNGLEFDGIEFMCNRTYSDVGTRYYKFNVTDNLNYTDEEEDPISITVDPTSPVSPLSLTLIGDGSSVGREYNDVTYLGLQFRDELKGTINFGGVNGTVYMSTDGNTFSNYTNIQTQGDGMFNYSFDPDCKFQRGRQWWRIVMNDSCYLPSSSAIGGVNQSVYVYGQLKNNILVPSEDDMFLVGDILTITSNITSDCLENIDNATVTHEAISPLGPAEEANMTSIVNEYDGVYNSTWNTSFHEGGYWTFRFNSSKQYYYSNTTTYPDWIYLNNTPPEYGNYSVDPGEEGWGRTFNFTVDVSDFQYDNVTCTLFTSTDDKTTWINRGSTTVYWGEGTCNITVSNFQCSDIGTDNYYRFQIDDGTTENLLNTSDQSGFNITEDDVILYYAYGNNTVVNRSDDYISPEISGTDVLFIVGMNDTDKGNIPVENANLSFWVTTDGVIWGDENRTETNASGYSNHYFNPDCGYLAGQQKWRAGIVSSCYVNVNTTNYTINITGNLISSSIQLLPFDDPTILRSEENVSIEVTIKDECTIEREGVDIDFGLNGDNGIFNCTPVNDVGEGVYRCERNTSVLNAGWYNMSVNASKEFYLTNDTYIESNFFFIETRPEVNNYTVSSTQGGEIGGWGERFYFTANITDEDLDNVTVELYVRSYGDSWGIAVNDTDVISPINETVTLSWAGGTCGDIGTWEYMIRARDDGNYPIQSDDQYITDSVPQNFTLERDNVIVNYGEGNSREIWRNGTDSGIISLLITDTDNGQILGGGYQGAFWVTTNGNDFIGEKIVTTNGTGHIVYDFPAEKPIDQYRCNFSTGIQQWKGGIYNDNCYKNTTSDNYTLILKSLTSPSVVHPVGVGYIRGDYVPVNGTIVDECGYVEEATVVYTYIPQASPQNSYTCTISSNDGWQEGEGWYNCTKRTVGRHQGWYNVKMDVSETYHASNTTQRDYSFNLGRLPELTDAEVDSYIGPWGQTYTFTVIFTDADYNTNNISLWKSYDGNSWSLVDSTTASGISVPIQFSHKFSCDDYISQSPYFYFKFNTSDEFNFTAETTPQNMTLTVDNVTIDVLPQSSSEVRRMGDNLALLAVRIRDTDYDSYISNGSMIINVTEDGSTYTFTDTCNSTDGYCNITYDPNCSITDVGLQHWIAQTSDVCYNITNTPAQDFTVFGQLNVSLDYPTSGTVIQRSTYTNLNASVKNNCGETISDSNVTWYNGTWGQLASGYNTTWLVSEAQETGLRYIRVNSTRQYYDQNTNQTQVEIHGWSDVGYIEPLNGSHHSAGDIVTVGCRIIDSNTTSPISNYTVDIYKDSTLLDTKLTDENGYVSTPWSTISELASWFNLSCNISTNSTLYYTTSYPMNYTLVKIDRQLEITEIYNSHPSIYRNNSFIYNSTNITVHVNDANIGDADNATVWFYNSTTFLGSCNTNSTGYCSFEYNPPETIPPNLYTLYLNSTKSGLDDSFTNQTQIQVKGVMILNITSPTNNSQKAKWEVIDLQATLSSENGIPMTNTIYWYNETNLIAIGNDTILSLISQQTGLKELIANASQNNYDLGQDIVYIVVGGRAGVDWISPTNETQIPYMIPFNSTCRVLDLDSASGISDYNTTFSYKWGLSGPYSVNQSNTTDSEGLINFEFLPNQKGYLTLKCNITDDEIQQYNASVEEVVAVLESWDFEAPQIFNISVYPNSSLEANLNSTIINTTITDNYNVNSTGVWVQILFPSPNNTLVNMTLDDLGNGSYGGSYIPPIGGTYNITIFAQDEPPEANINYTFASNVSVFGKVYGIVYQEPEIVYVSSITQTQSYSFEVTTNFTNTGPATAYDVNLTHLEEPIDGVTYNESEFSCGNMLVNETCGPWTFLVTVPEATRPGLIRSYVVGTWRNPDNTINSTSNITDIIVSSNPVIEIHESELEQTTPHDLETYIGNITIKAAGNDEVFDIVVSTLAGNMEIECPECYDSLEVVPYEEGLLEPGTNFTSHFNVTVPAGQNPGNYWTKIRASSSNAGYDEIIMNLTVPINMTWTRTTNIPSVVLTPPNTSGNFGNINVTNYGNIKIPYQIYRQGNATAYVNTDPLAFDLFKQASREIIVNYSIPETIQEALYTINIIVRNSSADPNEYITPIILNVTDIPPIIADLQIPEAFEVGYETINISANVTDNFAVDDVWVNFTDPQNNSFIKFMDNVNGSIYTSNYSSSVPGTHSISVCANDSVSNVGCYQAYTQGMDETNMSIFSNQTYIIVNDITIDNNYSIPLELGMNNTGYARGFNSTINLNTTENNIYFPEPSVYLGLILKNSSSSNQTTILVRNGTAPGFYNVDLLANWTNIDSSIGYNSTNITINVTSNPSLLLPDNITKVVPDGSTGYTSMDIKSNGNAHVYNITYSCKNGTVCENFTFSLDPTNITSLNSSFTETVNITISVPLKFTVGVYNGTIEVNASDGIREEVPIFVSVPENLTWSQSPAEISEIVLNNYANEFGSINMENTGNSPILLNINVSGNISDYLDLTDSSVYLQLEEERQLNINYSSPDIKTDSNYTGVIIISNTTTEIEPIKYVNLSLYVTNFENDIKYPLSTNPVIDLLLGDSILAKVNVSSNNEVLDSGINFTVKIFNETMTQTISLNSTEFNSTEDLWYLNFTAPDLSLNRAYNLNVTADRNSTDEINITHIRDDIEYDSIIYSDTRLPIIHSIEVPLRIPINSTVNIRINVTEEGSIKNATGLITYPNSDTQLFNLSLISRNIDNYLYELNFTNTSQENIYTINATFCDHSGNCNSSLETFEIYPVATISGYSKDYELISEPPVLSNFSFYDSGEDSVRFSFLSNISTGYYNETIDAKTYDLTLTVLNNTISQNNITVSTNVYNPVIVGKIPGVRVSESALKGFYVNSVFNSTGNSLSLDFYECVEGNCQINLFTVSYLGVYKCNNWNRKIGCNPVTAWTRLSDAVVNTTDFTVKVDTDSLSGAYVLAEYICGDEACESEYGENSDNCPTDCPTLPEPPGGGGQAGGGGGGGAAGGAGAGAAGGAGQGPSKISIPPTPKVRFVPMEVKSALLDAILTPGEQRTFGLDIMNNLDFETEADISIEGPVFSLLELQNNRVTLPEKSVENVQVKASVPIDFAPGIYTGDIVIKTEEATYRTPIAIKVKPVEEPLMDVKIKILSKTVRPGGDVNFEISILNMGETATIEDITMTYFIMPLEDQTKIIAQEAETLAVDDVLTFTRTIKLPENIQSGRYIVYGNASYWYGGKVAISVDNFEVSSTPVPLLMLRAVLMSPITYIILFVGVPAVYIGLRWYMAYRAMKKAKARYITPLELKKLPQPGENAIEVGKIAETDVKAYVDISQLLVHSIAAGGTGSGKTVSAMVCAEELLKRKVPVIVFDPTAQWTGFMKPCSLKPMLDLYPKFGLKPSDARSFKTNIILVDDPDMEVNVKEHMKPGELTVFILNRLPPGQLDPFVQRSIQSIFDMRPKESKKIQLMLVYDEVHRLLPKYGGKKGYLSLERACREFRKWGIAVFLISQVLLDFKGAIRANIANEIQLRTKYEGDINRVKTKYGSDYASKVTKLTIGTGLFQNPEYNYGKPWFINFRPLLHSPFALKDEEVNSYIEINKKVIDLEKRIEKLKEKKVDTYDIELELNMVKDKVKVAAFTMAESYLEPLIKRVEKMEK